MKPVIPIPEIKPEQSIELLKELHILAREGKLNQDSRSKLKQVYHLYHFIEPLLAELLAGNEAMTLADHGAGKSYLGFILFDLFFKNRTGGHIFGIETREELVDKSRELAQRLQFGRMSFLNLSIEDSIRVATLPERIDMVTALHACDTATDDAIRFALCKKARFIVFCAETRTIRLRKHRSRNSGATRSIPVNLAVRSPTCCAVYSSKLAAIRYR